MLHLTHLPEQEIRGALQTAPITKLTLEQGTFSNLDFLELVPDLTELQLLSCFYLEAPEYEKIGALHELTSLTIDYANFLTSLEFLRTLPKLEKLTVTRCTQVTNIEPLLYTPRLTKLNLGASGQVFISEFDPISSLKNLEYLDLSNLVCLRDLHFLKGLTRLRFLNVNFCALLENIDVLKEMHSLEALHMKECFLVEAALGFILQKKLVQFSPPQEAEAARREPTTFLKI